MWKPFSFLRKKASQFPSTSPSSKAHFSILKGSVSVACKGWSPHPETGVTSPRGALPVLQGNFLAHVCLVPIISEAQFQKLQKGAGRLTPCPAANFPSSPVLQPTLQKQNLWLQTTNELLLAPGLISFHCNINDPNKPFQLSCCTAGILLFGIWSLYKKIPHASSSRPAPSKGNKITFLLSLSLWPTQGQ